MFSFCCAGRLHLSNHSYYDCVQVTKKKTSAVSHPGKSSHFNSCMLLGGVEALELHTGSWVFMHYY
jgi:hypothetical protein